VDPEPLLNPALLDASRLRTPIKLSREEQERRTLLLKEWSRYKMKQHKEDLKARSRAGTLWRRSFERTEEELVVSLPRSDQTGFKIRAGQRTMSGHDDYLTGQTFGLAVILPVTYTAFK